MNVASGSFKFVRLGILCSSLAMASLFSVGNRAIAAPRCGDLPNPEPGQSCSIEVPINRGPVGDGDEDYDFFHIAVDGYKIIDFKLRIHGRTGNTSEPSVLHKAADSNTVSTQEVENRRKELNDLFIQVESKLNNAAGDVKASREEFNELEAKFKKEFDSFHKSVSKFSTSHAGLQITERVRPEFDSLGFRKARGNINAIVEVVQVFVGTPTYLQQRSKDYDGKVLSLAASISKNDKNVTFSQVINNPPEGVADHGIPKKPSFLADVNGDGIRDYGRVVGNEPKDIMLSFQLGKQGGEFQSEPNAVTTIRGETDLGYDHFSRWIEDVNGDGRGDFCRFVGNIPPFPACLLSDGNSFPKENTPVQHVDDRFQVAQ
jgi:hypothetical protein